jgi:CheY-like chemotaxis protein/predicted transcriptional regulator
MQDNKGFSFSLVVIRRILDALVESGTIKKTNLAGKTRLNYSNCARYIDFLKLLGWVSTSADGTNSVCMTELGRRFSSILSVPSKQNGQIMPAFHDLDVALPRLDDGSIPTPVRNFSSHTPHSGDKFNIMLVDDEPDVLLTLKVLLAGEGYNVEAVLDGKSALQNLKSAGPSHYDLIVTDVRMRNINGLQLYQAIKSVDPSARVMFLSALDAVEELTSILPGVTTRDIIRKPVSQDAFVKMVKEMMEQEPAALVH